MFRRSSNGGDWQHVLGNVEAYTVFVHPKDAGTVLAGDSVQQRPRVGVWSPLEYGCHVRDVFRIFDALNWVPNMRVAMEAVLQTAGVCEAAICYSGDILNPQRDKYTLAY